MRACAGGGAGNRLLIRRGAGRTHAIGTELQMKKGVNQEARAAVPSVAQCSAVSNL